MKKLFIGFFLSVFCLELMASPGIVINVGGGAVVSGGATNALVHGAGGPYDAGGNFGVTNVGGKSITSPLVINNAVFNTMSVTNQITDINGLTAYLPNLRQLFGLNGFYPTVDAGKALLNTPAGYNTFDWANCLLISTNGNGIIPNLDWHIPGQITATNITAGNVTGLVMKANSFVGPLAGNAATATTLGSNIVIQTQFGATNFNSLDVANCPTNPGVANYNGRYLLAYSNTVAGNPWLVFTNISNTNCVEKNDPAQVVAGYNPPTWSVGISNDTAQSHTFSITDNGQSPPGDITQNPQWFNYAETQNFPVYVHYTYSNAPGNSLPPVTFSLASASNSVVYVDNVLGDDGHNGLTWITSVKSIAQAASIGGYGCTIMLAPGTFSDSPLYTNGFSIIGASQNGTIFTNTVSPQFGQHWENIWFLGGYSGKNLPANQITEIVNCQLGSFSSNSIDSFYTPAGGNLGIQKIIGSRLKSNWDNVNGISAGTYYFINDVMDAITYFTNAAGSLIPATRNNHISGTSSVYVMGCSLTVSNANAGQLTSAAEDTNACIVMDGTSCHLWIGNTSLNFTNSVKSTGIAYVNGATSGQVTWLDTYATGTEPFTGNGSGLTNVQGVATFGIVAGQTNLNNSGNLITCSATVTNASLVLGGSISQFALIASATLPLSATALNIPNASTAIGGALQTNIVTIQGYVSNGWFWAFTNLGPAPATTDTNYLRTGSINWH